MDSSESVDTDSDGIGDNSDNCRTNANADQADADGNGIGDVCETTTEKTITANRDNSVHGKSSGSDQRDEVHNYSRVEILSNGSYTVAGLFGFNLSDNITSNQTVDNATLRLTIDEIKTANSSKIIMFMELMMTGMIMLLGILILVRSQTLAIVLVV